MPLFRDGSTAPIANDGPVALPLGEWLQNPSNPASGKRVQFGLQSWDEMFIGFFDAADDSEPLPPSLSQKGSSPTGGPTLR